MKNRCFACGWDLGDYAPWGPDGTTPEYGICPSCGCEFGNDDHSGVSLAWFRSRWIAAGCPWWSSVERSPQGWDAQEQLRHVPSFIDYDPNGYAIEPGTLDRVARRCLVPDDDE